jgi:hypothetical protein
MAEFPKPEIKHKYSDFIKKIIIDDTRIKHKDFFNVKYLYMMCHEWLMEHNWAPSKDDKWPERMYLHKWPATGGEEVWIWWRFRKEFSNLLKCDLDIDWHIVGMESAEMIKDGKKYKVNKGEVEFKIYVKLIFDPKQDFNKNKFLSSIKETFWQRIYYKEILAQRKQLYHDVYEFKQVVKTYLNLQTYLPEAEGSKFWLDDTLHTPFYDDNNKNTGPPNMGPPPRK